PRDAVHAVAQALPPEEVPVERHGDLLPGIQVQRRGQVDHVERPDRVQEVEVDARREQRVESLEVGRVRVVVAAGEIEPQAEGRRGKGSGGGGGGWGGRSGRLEGTGFAALQASMLPEPNRPNCQSYSRLYSHGNGLPQSRVPSVLRSS